MLVHGVRNSNQVFHGRQTILGENFTGRPRTGQNFFLIRMLARDLFAVANLLVYILPEDYHCFQ